MHKMGAELPLVAHAPKLAILTGAVEAATVGAGEIALITGESGVGKSACYRGDRAEWQRLRVCWSRGTALRRVVVVPPLW